MGQKIFFIFPKCQKKFWVVGLKVGRQGYSKQTIFYSRPEVKMLGNVQTQVVLYIWTLEGQGEGDFSPSLVCPFFSSPMSKAHKVSL